MKGHVGQTAGVIFRFQHADVAIDVETATPCAGCIAQKGCIGHREHTHDIEAAAIIVSQVVAKGAAADIDQPKRRHTAAITVKAGAGRHIVADQAVIEREIGKGINAAAIAIFDPPVLDNQVCNGQGFGGVDHPSARCRIEGGRIGNRITGKPVGGGIATRQGHSFVDVDTLGRTVNFIHTGACTGDLDCVTRRRSIDGLLYSLAITAAVEGNAIVGRSKADVQRCDRMENRGSAAIIVSGVDRIFIGSQRAGTPGCYTAAIDSNHRQRCGALGKGYNTAGGRCAILLHSCRKAGACTDLRW